MLELGRALHPWSAGLKMKHNSRRQSSYLSGKKVAPANVKFIHYFRPAVSGILLMENFSLPLQLAFLSIKFKLF